MRLRPVDEYHEDMGVRIFVGFSRNSEGEILGEEPEVVCCSGYLDPEFDETFWTHFIDNDLNFMFSDADPERFPLCDLTDYLNRS